MFYLIDQESVDVENLEFDEDGSPGFAVVEADEDIQELILTRENRSLEESQVYVENEMDFEPGTNQYDQCVMSEMESRYAIVNDHGLLVDDLGGLL